MNTTSSESVTLIPPTSSLTNPSSGTGKKIFELDQKLKAALETAENIAEIVLTVTDFKEVLHTRAVDRGTQYKMKVGEKNYCIRVDESGDAPKLKVKKDAGPITLKFTIVDAKTDETYYPLAVSFKWHSSIPGGEQPDADLNGRQNIPFNSMHVYDTHVYLTGFCMPQEKGIDYKFSAVFQREDAKIAIIDPGVENDN